MFKDKGVFRRFLLAACRIRYSQFVYPLKQRHSSKRNQWKFKCSFFPFHFDGRQFAVASFIIVKKETWPSSRLVHRYIPNSAFQLWYIVFILSTLPNRM